MTFMGSHEKRRSDLDFRNFEDPEHHNSVSNIICIEPSIDMIRQFILDPMHLWIIGGMGRMLEFWLSRKNSFCKLSNLLQKELERRSLMIKKCIPDEYPRKMRSIKRSGKYKSVEFLFLLKVCGPVIFKKLLGKNVYRHFLLFHLAYRLILSREDAINNVSEAKQFLEELVEEAPIIYGPTFSTINIHNFIHTTEDIIFTKCNLNRLSAFRFENFLLKVSSYVLLFNA